MGKFFYLLWQKTGTLIKRNRLVFFVFMAVQIVTIFSYIFFYSTVIKSQTDYVSNYDNMCRISVTLPELNKNTDFTKKIINNGVAAPRQIIFYFSASNDKNSKQLWAYLYPEKESGGISGNRITTDDINKKTLVIIPANADKGVDPDPTHHESHVVGDMLNIANLTFYAKGIRYSGWLDEIPYTTGFEHFKLKGFDILVPPKLTDTEKQQIGNYCMNTLGAINVKLPEPIAQKVFTELFFPLVASIFIGIISILNFIFLYRYMIERSRRNYILLRFCGCSRNKCLALMFCQLIGLFTVSFFISTLVLVLLKVFGGSTFASVSLSTSSNAIVYSTFLLFILIIIFPIGLRFFKKSLITEEKLLP